MGKVESYTQKKGIFTDYYEETITDGETTVKAAGHDKEQARNRAERKFRDKKLED